MKMVYSKHYRDDAQGHIFIEKEGACTVHLTGAAAMPQKELDQYGELFAKSPKMLAVLKKLVASFPEMDTDEPINGADAVDTLCAMWDEIKDAIK